MEKTVPVYPTKVFAEIIVLAALSGVLYAVRPFSLPYGGSVTMGSMVPVMWLSLRRGVRAGCISGVIFGIIALPIDVGLLGGGNTVATPFQAVVEYPLAFGVVGLTGLLHQKSGTSAVAGVAFAVFIKFLLHYLIGVFVWFYIHTLGFSEYGQLLWPAIHSGSSLAVEFAISAIVIFALVHTKTLDYGI